VPRAVIVPWMTQRRGMTYARDNSIILDDDIFNNKKAVERDDDTGDKSVRNLDKEITSKTIFHITLFFNHTKGGNGTRVKIVA